MFWPRGLTPGALRTLRISPDTCEKKKGRQKRERTLWRGTIVCPEHCVSRTFRQDDTLIVTQILTREKRVKEHKLSLLRPVLSGITCQCVCRMKGRLSSESSPSSIFVVYTRPERRNVVRRPTSVPCTSSYSILGKFKFFQW